MAAAFNFPTCVATLNVRGLRNVRRQRQLHNVLLQHHVDVAAVQETKISATGDIDSALENFADYDVCISQSQGASAGCFLLIRKQLNHSLTSLRVDGEGRLICCDISFHSRHWRFICVYAPTKVNDRKLFFLSLAPLLNTDRDLIVLGDFNCVCDTRDHSYITNRYDASASSLQQIVNDNNLIDVGAYVPASVRFTHFQGVSHARLDRVYISVNLWSHIHNYAVKPIFFTDHCLVAVSWGPRKFGKLPPNWDLWKLNIQLLREETFVKKVKELILEMTQCRQLPIFARWELFKEKVKSEAIGISCEIAQGKRAEKRYLHDLLHKLHVFESQQPGQYVDEINVVRAQMQKHDTDAYRGAMVRSRASRFISEEPTKKALGDEKRYALSKEILEIESHGSVCTEASQITAVFEDHYRNLFTAARRLSDYEEKADQFIALMPHLQDDDRLIVDGPIMKEEIKCAIGALQRNKTPGPDGLSAEFYVVFEEMLLPFVELLFKEAYERGELPNSFYQGYTTLIPKSTDSEALKRVTGYRPISLCNVDYKIFAKVLTNRLQIIITKLVGDHQTCGIRSRSIQTNIHIARSVLECIEGSVDQVALLQIDLAKAFDKVQHDFLFRLLRHLRLGDALYKGIALCYKRCTTRLIVNRTLSDVIQVNSSVRQGCPLSPLFFAIYMEPLCLSVLVNSSIRGYRYEVEEIKDLAYADDIAFFCTDKPSVQEAIDTTLRFCDIAELALTLKKVEDFG